MVHEIGNDLYHRGNDLGNKNKTILFQKVIEEFDKQHEIVAILSQKEINQQKLTRCKNKIHELTKHKAPEFQIKRMERIYSTINATQLNIITTLQPKFDEVFDKVADDPALGGLGYNESLKTSVRFDVIFGQREIPGAVDGAREHYKFSFTDPLKEAKYEEKKKKRRETMKKEKEKVQLPRDHFLLHEESYPKLKRIMWTHIDNVVATYQKKFLNDTNDIRQLQGLIDHYFLFIFFQMLVQSKVVFDTKKPKSYPFFKQVIDDCLSYLQKKYHVSLTISSDNIKKRFFSTIDETSKPLELLYKNCIEEDLLYREEYLNIYFFKPENTSVDHVRRKVMAKYNKSENKIKKTFEILNPLYHIAKEKKAKILKTIEILTRHDAKNNIIAETINRLKENLKKAEKDVQDKAVFEEDALPSKNPDSLIKIQQQYLKYYQVPVQYRKIFGLVINRINGFYQMKTALSKKANKHNNEVFEQLIHSDQSMENILYYINDLITQSQISALFDERWTKKQEEKVKTIQSFCLGTKKMVIPPKKSTGTEEQYSLNF